MDESTTPTAPSASAAGADLSAPQLSGHISARGFAALETTLILPAATAHVWFHRLDDSPWAQQELPDAAEEQRAQGFLTLQLQQHFRAAHGFKRALLSRYCQQPPERLVFQSLRYGKPQLEHSALHFNLSHSHGWCVLAVAHQAVGVDVEAVQRSGQWRELRRMCLHPLESADTAEEFFRIWCAKEAVGKWDGRGLGVSFPYLQLHALNGERTASAHHWRPQYQTQKPAQLPLAAGQVVCLPAPQGMAAALAWGAEACQIHCFLT